MSPLVVALALSLPLTPGHVRPPLSSLSLFTLPATAAVVSTIWSASTSVLQGCEWVTMFVSSASDFFSNSDQLVTPMTCLQTIRTAFMYPVAQVKLNGRPLPHLPLLLLLLFVFAVLILRTLAVSLDNAMQQK